MSDWDLRKYLEENRSVFDDKEPPDEHRERFEARLNSFATEKKYKHRLKIRLIATLSAAASILLIVATGIWLLAPPPGNGAMQNSDEFAETETFYRIQMNEQMAAILCKLNNADAETRNRLKEDLQYLTATNDELVEEMRSSKDKDEELAIYYLVEHYSINLEILELINEKLSEYFSC
jgi:hypothetical protein